MKALTRVKTKQKVKENSFAGLDQTTKLAISLMVGVSVIVGTWAAASIISAMIGSGGLLELSQSWFSAVTGM